MKLLTNVFDMWVFTRGDAEPRYLLLHTSQEKADKFFGGGRFWQIPGAFLDEDEQVPDVLDRPLDELGLQPSAVWAIEHVYPIFNRRFNDMQLIPVFAAEVPGPTEPQLTWEHSEAGWYTAAECNQRLIFRGLKEGLHWLRHYVSEADTPDQVFRLR